MNLTFRMDKCIRDLANSFTKLKCYLIRKQVEFDKGHVLLSRIGDNIHATSAFCTHYGAPLAKGVLTSDGRVVWYVSTDPTCSALMVWSSAPGMEVLGPYAARHHRF